MKITVERNWIELIGRIWLPPVVCAQRIDLDSYAIASIGEPTRDNVADWLTTRSGDFQVVLDFSAVIGEARIDWEHEESADTYVDCMYPAEA